MMTKKAQVVMLPTKDKTHLHQRKSDGVLQYSIQPNNQNPLWQPQHLYFIADEEIKQSDWYLLDIRDTFAEPLKRTDNCLVSQEDKRKIVATTNKELWHWKIKCKVCNASGFNPAPHHCKECNGSGVHNEILIPKISTDFMQAYERDQGEIKEVLLEYKEVFYYGNSGQGTVTTRIAPHEKLKLRSNGTVIIHPIEEKLYTEKQMKDITWEAWKLNHTYGIESRAEFDNWFNLFLK